MSLINENIIQRINKMIIKKKTNVLVLFSGTGSIENCFDKSIYNIRGLDICNKYKPYYNTDILTWDYKTVFNNWIPDYIHCSPVCTEFSYLKNNNRDINKGLLLVDKTIEIIKYLQTINSNLKFTIENPKGFLRKQKIMKEFNMITTSYCKYGFDYRKDTDFWYGGFKLVLKPKCTCRTPCEYSKNNTRNAHRVVLGISRCSAFRTTEFWKTSNQITDTEHLYELRKIDSKYDKYNVQDLRYRIPSELVYDIIKCLNKPKLIITKKLVNPM